MLSLSYMYQSMRDGRLHMRQPLYASSSHAPFAVCRQWLARYTACLGLSQNEYVTAVALL